MPPGGAQEEMDEVHADLRKHDDEVCILFQCIESVFKEAKSTVVNST